MLKEARASLDRSRHDLPVSVEALDLRPGRLTVQGHLRLASGMRCPHCEANFAADEREELGRAAYLRMWIEDHRDEGILPADLPPRP